MRLLKYFRKFTLVFLFPFLQVVLRKDNKITLYCKGADSTVFERLNSQSSDIQETTTLHLEVIAVAVHVTLLLKVISTF
jgi:hypothetical protein